MNPNPESHETPSVCNSSYVHLSLVYGHQSIHTREVTPFDTITHPTPSEAVSSPKPTLFLVVNNTDFISVSVFVVEGISKLPYKDLEEGPGTGGPLEGPGP